MHPLTVFSLVLIVPFVLMTLLSMSNGSFQRGWERGAARMEAEGRLR
jgi:hypothetical protein